MEKGIGSGLAPRLNVAIVVARIFFEVKYRVIAEKFGVEESKAKDIVIEAKERASSVDPMAILACAGKFVSRAPAAHPRSLAQSLGLSAERLIWKISNKARDNFCDELQHVLFQLKRNNSWVDEEFGADEATAIANLFFSDMIGPKALQNIQNYIKEYTTDYRDGLDKGVATRAAAEAKVTTYPKQIRLFFGVFAHAQVTKSEPQSLLANLHKIEAYVRLLGHYDTLQALAARKDKKLVRFLRMQKYRTRSNVTLRPCIKSFLAKRVGITKAALTKTCQTAEAVIALTSRFGPGVLLLLPKNGMGKHADDTRTRLYRLNKWGKQRMAEVLPLLERHADFIKPVCKLLEKSIYGPIQAGQPLQISQISASSIRKLLRGDITFRAAIKRAVKDWKRQQEDSEEDTDVLDASEGEIARDETLDSGDEEIISGEVRHRSLEDSGDSEESDGGTTPDDEALDTGDEEVIEGVAYDCVSEDSEDLDDSEDSEDSGDLDDGEDSQDDGGVEFEDEDDMEGVEHFRLY